MCVYLRTKFQVSSVILRSFTQGEILLHTANETLKSPPRLRLMKCLVYLFHTYGPLVPLLYDAIQNNWFLFKLQEN